MPVWPATMSTGRHAPSPSPRALPAADVPRRSLHTPIRKRLSLMPFVYPAQKSLPCSLNLHDVSARKRPTGDNHNINWEHNPLPVAAKNLPHPTLAAIAHHRIANLLSDHQPQPRLAGRRLSITNEKKTTVKALALPAYTQKLGRMAQPIRSREPLATRNGQRIKPRSTAADPCGGDLPISDGHRVSRSGRGIHSGVPA